MVLALKVWSRLHTVKTTNAQNSRLKFTTARAPTTNINPKPQGARPRLQGLFRNGGQRQRQRQKQRQRRRHRQRRGERHRRRQTQTESHRYRDRNRQRQSQRQRQALSRYEGGSPDRWHSPQGLYNILFISFGDATTNEK